MNQPQGPWKEGRVGGVSLVYVDLDADDLTAVAAHHAAVGIRATIATDPRTPGLDTLAQRNWDLALTDANADANAALQTLDGKPEHGIVGEAAASDALYRLGPNAGQIAAPPASPPDPLPSNPPPTDLPALQSEIESVMATHGWTIYRFDAATLHALGREHHAALLRWLGDHHARIWCAPVRDIRAFLLG